MFSPISAIDLTPPPKGPYIRRARESDPRFPAWIALTLCVLALIACASKPRSQACTTDDVCRDELGKSAYCFQAHCVECVSHATCGSGKRCVDGACEAR